MTARFLTAILFSLSLTAVPADQSFTLDPAKVARAPIEQPGMPPGLMARVLHQNPRTKMATFMVNYPKGFDEPRHYHESCGHYIYIIKGRLRSAEGDLVPGMFTYAAPGERHGPYHAVEATEILFYTDGPFDFLVDEKGAGK